MNKKTNLLIVTAIIALVALISVQSYLIFNTYNLKKSNFLKEVQQQLKFLDTNSRTESWDDFYLAELKYLIKSNKKGNIKDIEVLPQFRKSLDSINTEFKMYYQQKMKEKKLPYKIEFGQYLTSVIAFNSVKNDTLFNEQDTPILLFGTEIESSNRKIFNTNKWFSESSTKQSELEVLLVNDSLALEIKSVSTFYVPKYLSIVLLRMIGFLLLSVFALCAVIGLFVYALLMLIKQKRIADVKTDFVNNITHELHTPLATLQVATDTLKSKAVQQNEAILNASIKSIERQNKRLQNIIEQVMTNALGEDKISLQKNKINIDAFLNVLVTDIKLTQPKSIKVDTRLSCNSACVLIDKTHFASVINNVLENAIKYGSTHIEVSSKLENTTCILKFKDDGLGIKNSEHKKVFEKFYRIKTGNLHETKGLGLGLFYVKKIVDAHGGSVNITSNSIKGITVEINFPIA